MTIKHNNHENYNSHSQDDIAYASWKNWKYEEFGYLRKIDSAYFSKLLSTIKLYLPKKTRVLEIGFGNGAFLQFAKIKGWDIYGLEINRELLKVAEKNLFNVSYADKPLPFPDNYFDLVVAFDLLEHIDQESLVDYIAEIKRVIRNDGFFVSRFPNGDSPFGLYAQNGDLTHKTFIGIGKIRYLIDRNNMSIFYLTGDVQPLFGVSFIHFVHRLITLPIKSIINTLVKYIFFPKGDVDFCSINLTVISRVKKDHE
jgi:SAM-dependent methyltransferase